MSQSASQHAFLFSNIRPLYQLRHALSSSAPPSPPNSPRVTPNHVDPHARTIRAGRALDMIGKLAAISAASANAALFARRRRDMKSAAKNPTTPSLRLPPRKKNPRSDDARRSGVPRWTNSRVSGYNPCTPGGSESLLFLKTTSPVDQAWNPSVCESKSPIPRRASFYQILPPAGNRIFLASEDFPTKTRTCAMGIPPEARGTWAKPVANASAARAAAETMSNARCSAI